MNTIIECVLFKLNDGVTKEEFISAAEKSNQFVASQPGFVTRRLSCSEEGQWLDHIEWQSMESAKNAAEKIGSDESALPFISLIDGPSVSMFHLGLEVAVN